MIANSRTRKALSAALLGAGLIFCMPVPAQARDASAVAGPVVVHARDGGVDVRLGGDSLSLTLVRGDVLHVHYMPHGCVSAPSLVMAPNAPTRARVPVHVTHRGDTWTVSSRDLRVVLDARSLKLSAYAPGSDAPLVYQRDLADIANRNLVLEFPKDATLYGVNGYDNKDPSTAGIVREGMQVAKAGEQGEVGAPFVWSTAGFGVLVDTRGATFDLGEGELRARKTSRPDLSYYLIAGGPKAIFTALGELSGRPQLFPKWAAGFTNSQWGIDQKELLDIVRTYRAKHIPIDNFTLDFDWKAWGDDHYGEFRWNPVKFPDGPSGKLTKELARQGIKLTGIMKPRLHVHTEEGRYAAEHHLWVPGERVYDDYFSHKPVLDIDFDKAASRAWFGKVAMKYAFDKGIVGWWNDEADTLDDDTQFLNMERSLYDAQRKISDVRVWSINRNFWLGSQRYAYAMWSGDIPTGFASMAGQRERMLSAVNVGESLWGMDGGGFSGHPSDENYARWIELGAFTPIFRVHGAKPEKRQPWHYGPVAEKAATHAIRLRYRLIPYIYSYFRQAHDDGIGLVRPLAFTWPHDAKVRNDVNAWMFGDWLLVSPVVQQGQTGKDIYLPQGTWTDYFSGKVYQGGRTIHVATDARTWMDIPLFIRQGAIIPTQPLMDYVGQRPVKTVTLDVFPAARRTGFDYYDDNGTTYAYEHGAYFQQHLSTRQSGGVVNFDAAAPQGSFHPALSHYLVKIHGTAAASLQGVKHRYDDLKTLEKASGEGWAIGHDRYGVVTYVKLAAGRKRDLRIEAQVKH